MAEAKTTARIPALFLSGVIVNWVVLFLWAWVPLRVEAAGALLAGGTAMLFAGALRKK